MRLRLLSNGVDPNTTYWCLARCLLAKLSAAQFSKRHFRAASALLLLKHHLHTGTVVQSWDSSVGSARAAQSVKWKFWWKRACGVTGNARRYRNAQPRGGGRSGAALWQRATVSLQRSCCLLSYNVLNHRNEFTRIPFLLELNKLSRLLQSGISTREALATEDKA